MQARLKQWAEEDRRECLDRVISILESVSARCIADNASPWPASLLSRPTPAPPPPVPALVAHPRAEGARTSDELLFSDPFHLLDPPSDVLSRNRDLTTVPAPPPAPPPTPPPPREPEEVEDLVWLIRRGLRSVRTLWSQLPPPLGKLPEVLDRNAKLLSEGAKEAMNPREWRRRSTLRFGWGQTPKGAAEGGVHEGSGTARDVELPEQSLLCQACAGLPPVGSGAPASCRCSGRQVPVDDRW